MKRIFVALPWLFGTALCMGGQGPSYPPYPVSKYGMDPNDLLKQKGGNEPQNDQDGMKFYL